MQVSEQWLREWVASRADIDTIAERLTMAGLEVDAVEPAAPSLDRVVIGRIEDTMPHPEADRLRLCTVAVGGAEPLSIVCGAANAQTGARVPVARVGAVLAGGVAIEATTIRGVASSGMLCSASELGLGTDDDGLWQLPDDAPVGTPLADYLRLPDHVLEIDLTPNRGDCLSMRGIAREVAIDEDLPLGEPDVTPCAVVSTVRRDVGIDAPERCAGYAARCITSVGADAATPLWMAERLRRAGVRRINLPVDVGNYVMLELGQPMHAFDGDRLVGAIRVRLAVPGERIETLDGETVALADDTLVIADDEGPVAIAGVIGGERTAVDATTTHVVFESACFTPSAVAGQGRRYKIHTDALHRFERGVDPALHRPALERASALLIAHGGGEVGPVTHVRGEPVWPQSREIALEGAHVERLLGQPVAAVEIERILGALGMVVETTDEDRWHVVPPSWRYDIELEADLIEEVARIYGYERLQSGTQGVDLPPAEAGAAVDDEARWHQTLRQRGYSEAITYSFVEPGLHRALMGEGAVVALDNPISEQYAEMRRTLWAGLLPSWQHNVRRQHTDVRLYEAGLRFEPDTAAEHGIAQISTLAGLIWGQAENTHWDRPSRAVDFFDIKGDVEALFAGVSGRLRFDAASHPALHPGRSARIRLDGEAVGWLGQLAPEFKKLSKKSDLPYLFEVDSHALSDRGGIRFESLSEQPRIRRDLAVVVAEERPVAELIDVIEDLDPPALQSIDVFDVFRGEGLERGFKSVALGLIFQDKASTLTDSSVDTTISAVVEALGRRCGAHIRGE